MRKYVKTRFNVNLFQNVLSQSIREQGVYYNILCGEILDQRIVEYLLYSSTQSLFEPGFAQEEAKKIDDTSVRIAPLKTEFKQELFARCQQIFSQNRDVKDSKNIVSTTDVAAGRPPWCVTFNP